VKLKVFSLLGKEEHFARAAELITISDEEFSRRLSEPVKVSAEHPSDHHVAHDDFGRRTGLPSGQSAHP
jgi:hypothetical protein